MSFLKHKTYLKWYTTVENCNYIIFRNAFITTIIIHPVIPNINQKVQTRIKIFYHDNFKYYLIKLQYLRVQFNMFYT